MKIKFIKATKNEMLLLWVANFFWMVVAAKVLMPYGWTRALIIAGLTLAFMLCVFKFARNKTIIT